MSDSNRTRLSYTREQSFGVVVPTLTAENVTGTNTLRAIRFTKEAFEHEKDVVQSDEIRATRTVADLIQVGAKGSGNFDAEFSADDYDDLVAAVMQADYSTTVSATVNFFSTGVAATGTLTSDNTNVADGAAVVIGNKTYTFRTALTPTEGEVLIGADADGSLLNLINAINHTGTPGTDYSAAAAHTQVSAAASVTSHAFLITALVVGVAANSYATTENSNHLSFGAATLTGGHDTSSIEATTGTPFASLLAAKFIKIANAATSTNNGVKTVVSITSTSIVLGEGQLFASDTADAITVSVNYVTAIDSVTVTVAGQVMTASVGTFSTAVQGARYVKIANAATVGNNGIKKVVSCTSTVLTLATGSLTGSDAGDALTVQCNYVRTGTTYITHLIQKDFVEIARYIVMSGMGVDTWDFKMAAKGKVMQTFAFMGLRGQSRSNPVNDVVAIAPSSNTIVNTSSNIGSVTKDGVAMTNPVRSVNFKLNNNLRERPVIASLYSQEHGSGYSLITGDVEVYFTDAAMLALFIAHTPFALEFPVVDNSGNTFNVYMPRIQSSKGTPQVPGVNADVMQTLNFQALPDLTTGVQLQIDRLLA